MVLAATRLHGADWFVIIAYFVLMLGVGIYFFRYMKAMKDYFTGGNRIPWWLSGISYYMTSFSAFAFVAYSALAYQYGLVGVTLYWVTVPAAFFSTLFFANRWRRARIHSPVEYLESRYSPGVRQVFAWQGVPVKMIDDALKLIAIGSFLVALLGKNTMTPEQTRQALEYTMLGAGGIMLAYTFLGGLWAVMITDFMQFLVQTAAVLVLFPLAFHAAGGFGHVWRSSPPEFFRFSHSEYGWVYLASTVFLYFLSYSVNWSLVQRFYCVPDEKESRKVGYLVVFLNIVTPPLMFAPAMAAPYFLPKLADAKLVYPEMCAYLLPAGLVGLVIAAMFSATMSMLSGDYNVCASVLTNDVYKRLIRPRASQKELVGIGRLMTLLVGLISIGVAIWMNRAGDNQGDKLFRTMVTLFSVAVPPVAIPMLWGLLSRRVNKTSALAGFIVGVAVGLVMLIQPESLFRHVPAAGSVLADTRLHLTWNADKDGTRLAEGVLFDGTTWAASWKLENLIFWVSGIVTLITIVVVNRLARQSDEERARAEQFIERLRVPVGRLPDDVLAGTASSSVSPFRVVGICTALVGMLLLVILPWVRGRPLALELNLGLGLLMLIGGGAMVRFSPRMQSPAGNPGPDGSARKETA